MVKMYLIKFEGKSSNYFKNGETYVARTGKDGSVYMFNEKGYWSRAISRKMTKANLIKPIDIEKVFYVNNHKEALSYPQIVKENWGVDLKRIRDREEFTFTRPAIRAYYGIDIVYTSKMLADDILRTLWINPETKTKESFDNEEDAYNNLIGMIKDGLWVITQKERV